MASVDKAMFEQLKQMCVKCVNEPNVDSIDSLTKFVCKCDKQFIKCLSQYAMFPLRIIIDKISPINNERLIVSSVDCLRHILEKSSINSFDMFAEIFAQLFRLIDENYYLSLHDRNTDTPIKLSEDLLLSVIKCCQSLIDSLDDTASKKLITKQFCPQLGHSFHILLNIAVSHKYYVLKIEAINTLSKILNKYKKIDGGIEANIGKPEDLMAFFIPGITTNICKLITSDDKLSKHAIHSALNVFSEVIVIVFNNVSDQSNDGNQTIKPNDENKQFFVNRNQTWIESTCEKLCLVFKSIKQCLISHQNFYVRQSLSKFVIKVLTNTCALFVNKCLTVLLEVPLTYLNDDCEQIAFECDSFIKKFSENYVNSESSKSCMDLLQDEIYLYITQLPRLIRMLNGAQKVSAICLLHGYLKCLGANGINALLYSSQHKQRLFQCLIDISQFDYRGVKILEQTSLLKEFDLSREEQTNLKWCKKSFKYIDDDKSLLSLNLCCQQIGRNGDFLLLIDFLVDSLTQSNLNPSVLFVSNSIVSNLNCSQTDISEIIELYLSFISERSTKQETIEKMNKEILRICLLIEGLTIFVRYYDDSTSHSYFLKCFYPLLELVGSVNRDIAQSSCVALNIIANYFSYTSISEMIASNIDYLINSINIKLRHFLSNQTVTIVVRVIFKYLDKALLYHFIETIDEILCVIDSYYHSQALPLLHVLLAFVSSLSDTTLTENVTNRAENRAIDLCERASDVVKCFKEFIDSKIISELLNEEENDNMSDNDLSEKEVKKEIPYYITAVENILERCVHLLSSNESNIRLVVLDIIIQSLHILAPFEDNLLPIAHSLWSPLVDRFKDKDVIVLRKAYSCLLVMSKTCKDFIRARTVKEVLPTVTTFLRTQRKISYKKDIGSAYRFTVAYQFQLDILLNIATIAINLDLIEKDLWQLIVEIIPYISVFQPKPLQDAAVNALKTLAQFDSCSVFFYLTNLYYPKNVVSNVDESFPPVLFNDIKNQEYENNIKLLLSDLFCIV